MRIIAGSARGTKLEVADGSPTRPFLEMARGALFNSLGGLVPEARVLDLYAGSGALGLEALSRGARSCVFVERDGNAVAALRKNIDKCHMAAVARIRQADVRGMAAPEDGKFDLVFVDPPFPELAEWNAGGQAEAVMRRTAEALAEKGVLVFRLEEGKAAPPEWPGLTLMKDKRYGRSRICRYGRNEKE